MTNTSVRSCSRGPLISVEGITGVGKTYLTQRASEGVTRTPLLLDAFSQRPSQRASGPPDLGRALLGALRDASADPFLRGGTPMAETLLLLAIKRHDLDLVVPELAAGRAVIEGRGVDSTAVCQALLLYSHDSTLNPVPATVLDTATALLALAARYRPPADRTILITDEPSAAVQRAQRRDQCVFTSEQVTFMHQAGALFERVATTDPARYRLVDRRTVTENEAVELIRERISGAGTGLGCLPDPWQGLGARCLCCGHRPDLDRTGPVPEPRGRAGARP
ncbi:dTMP kinase [Actinomadura harenae]|uniref:dTMP kinase n=1 Tax=Actinomadura harenae TaxID=2483351 RepID=UPI0018F54010|nr:thymidylate kinase [Actinomadura harenae]